LAGPISHAAAGRHRRGYCHWRVCLVVGPAGACNAVRQVRKLFFFEKKNQKTFATFGRSQGPAAWVKLRAKLAKVFWFFFSKKNTFLTCPARPE
jgi:hypothetical protein